MKTIKILIITALLMLPLCSAAQFSQPGSENSFMLKVEAGYMPFIGHAGEAPDDGYAISQFHNAANLNVMAGANISQDWFLGGGAGFLYFHNTQQQLAEPMMGVNVFADFDFRPIWKGVMGVDYQPVTIKWAPEVGGRLGGSILLDGMVFSPMAEVHAGVNWYYAHGLRNMSHNWHSFYLTLGVAYMQQAIFVPVRIGWRW